MSKPKTRPSLVSSYAPSDEPAPPVNELPVEKKATLQKVFVLTPVQNKSLKKFCADMEINIQQAVLRGLDLLYATRGLDPLSQEREKEKEGE